MIHLFLLKCFFRRGYIYRLLCFIAASKIGSYMA